MIVKVNRLLYYYGFTLYPGNEIDIIEAERDESEYFLVFLSPLDNQTEYWIDPSNCSYDG